VIWKKTVYSCWSKPEMYHMKQGEKLWNIGGGLTHFEDLAGYLNEVEEYYGLGGSLVDSVYDSHAGLPWNGGRYLPPFPFSLEESIRRVSYYNKKGIAFNITFSNRLLTPDDLSHEDCNYFLEQCHREGNGVIVASDLMREYIRSTYPRYRLIASIGFCRKDIDFYRKALELYDIVVLHPDLNRRYDLIRTLDTERLEVLVNEYCMDGCPFREEHAGYISNIIKEGALYFRNDSEHLGRSCLANIRGHRMEPRLILDFDQIEALNRLGIRRFKIQGREHRFEASLCKDLRRFVVRDTVRTLCRTAVPDM
jgi:collagenase-like PrtC family protease